MNTNAPRFDVNARLLAAALRFAAVNDARFYLCGVRLEPSPDGFGVLLIATDGHRLLVLRDVDGTATGSAIVERIQLPRDATAKPTKRGVPVCRVQFDGERATFTDGSSVPARYIDGMFPRWRDVVPTGDLTPSHVALNPAYVADCAVVSAAAGQRYHGVAIASNGANSSVLCTWEGVDGFAVIMPVRMTVAATAPAWFGMSAAEACTAARALYLVRRSRMRSSNPGADGSAEAVLTAGRAWLAARARLIAEGGAPVERLPFPADFCPVRFDVESEPTQAAPSVDVESEPAQVRERVGFLGIGQRVRYTGDMANVGGRGIVVSVERCPHQLLKIRVILGDGRDWTLAPRDFSRQLGQRFYLLDDVAGDIETTRMLQVAADRVAAVELEKVTRQQRHEAEVARLIAENPHLEPAAGNDGNVTGRNLRAALKHAGIKAASVRRERGSMCSSYRVRLPATCTDEQLEQAEQIGRRFQQGRFDGMTDCYEYDRFNAWCDAFGGVRYVFVNRDRRPARDVDADADGDSAQRARCGTIADDMPQNPPSARARMRWNAAAGTWTPATATAAG